MRPRGVWSCQEPQLFLSILWFMDTVPKMQISSFFSRVPWTDVIHSISFWWSLVVTDLTTICPPPITKVDQHLELLRSPCSSILSINPSREFTPHPRKTEKQRPHKGENSHHSGLAVQQILLSALFLGSCTSHLLFSLTKKKFTLHPCRLASRVSSTRSANTHFPSSHPPPRLPWTLRILNFHHPRTRQRTAGTALASIDLNKACLPSVRHNSTERALSALPLRFLLLALAPRMSATRST